MNWSREKIIRSLFPLATLAFIAPSLHAQPARKPALRNYPDTSRHDAYVIGLKNGDMVLVRGNRPVTADPAKLMVGDTILLASPAPILMDERAQRLNLGGQIKDSTLITELRDRVRMADSLARIQDTLITHWTNVHAIDSRTVDSLKAYYKKADDLIGQSTANTDRAIRHAYYSSVLVGAAGGAMAPGFSHSPVYNLVGAVSGALVGFGVNWLVFHLF